MKSLERLQQHQIKGSLRNILGGRMAPDTNRTDTWTSTDNVTCKTTTTTAKTQDDPDGTECTTYSTSTDQAS